MPNLPRWFVLSVGATVLALWVASFFAIIYVPNYKPDPIIGYAALLVVGTCFTYEGIKAAAKTKSSGDESKPGETGEKK